MPTKWLEGPDGLLWSVGSPDIRRDEDMSGLVLDGLIARERIVIKTVVTVYCILEEGREMPSDEATVYKVTRALTDGGSQRVLPPVPATTQN